MPDDSPLISAATLAERLGNRDLCVIDCRFDLFEPDAGRKAWLQAHIPGAIHADLDNDLAGPKTKHSGRHPLPDIREIEERLGQWGVGSDTDVVVYDAASGAFAARAWWMMHWLGHGRVRLLDGGFSAWTSGGYATATGPEYRRRVRFIARPQHDLVITTADVEDGLADGEPVTLLDARDGPRFRGEVEPIDPVAGHIPGAVSLPFSGNLAGDGRFRPPAELAGRFEGALRLRDGKRWGVMCGSGVTACHLALAAVHAGLEMPGLYVGSWSEWVTDPARPVETGD